MRVSLFCTVGCALGAAFASAPAVAQTRAPVERRLNYGLSTDVVYDTNVARSSETLAAQRGLEREDVRVTPAAFVDALLPLGRQSLSLNASAGYDFYNRNTRLNRERIAASALLGLDIAGCQGTASAAYSRRQSDLADLIFLPGETVGRRFRNVQDVKTVGASATCGGAIGIRPTASITHSWADNSAAVRSFSDYSSTVVEGGASYARPSFGTLTLFGRAGRTTFPNRFFPAGFAGGNDGFDQGAVGVRYERRIGSRLNGLAEVAYTRVNPDNSALGGFGGVTWTGELNAAVSGRLNLTALASRGVDSSNQVGANYSIQRIYSLAATYAVSERMTLTGTLYQRDRDFGGVGFIPGFGLFEDRTRSAQASLRYVQNRRFSYTLGATREHRDANGEFYDYSSTRLLAGVQLSL